jgi:hypothetical protein
VNTFCNTKTKLISVADHQQQHGEHLLHICFYYPEQIVARCQRAGLMHVNKFRAKNHTRTKGETAELEKENQEPKAAALCFWTEAVYWSSR